MVNIAACLPEIAAQQPNAVAVCMPAGRNTDGSVAYQRTTYAQLNEQSDVVAKGLAALGVGRGVRAVLMVPPGRHFFALTFGMAKAGVVPVMVDPGLPLRHLKTCINEARPAAFIGSPKAQAARLLLGWGKKTVRVNVTVGGPALWGGVRGYGWSTLLRHGQGSAAAAMAMTAADDVAAILFTSGSTGVPKGVVYTHGNFAAQVALLRQISGVGPGEVDLPTFPLFALFDPALGMTTVVPQMNFSRPAAANPQLLVEAMANEGVTNMFASPALVAALVRWALPRGQHMHELKRVVSAGAPVPPAIVEQMVSLMKPGGRVVTPYGATEALPVTCIDSRDILNLGDRTAQGAGVCVGKPVPGVRVAIVPIHDDSIAAWDPSSCLPVGGLGEIVVRGPQVTRSYWARPEATALAKIAVPNSEAFWHRMGDIGYFDANGFLWFCGRKSHRVVKDAQTTWFSVPSEGVFNAHPLVMRTALVGVSRGGQMQPVICVECKPDADLAIRKVKHQVPPLLDEQLRALGQAYKHTKGIDHFLLHPGFPVDIRHNAKIGREALALWAQERLQ